MVKKQDLSHHFLSPASLSVKQGQNACLLVVVRGKAPARGGHRGCPPPLAQSLGHDSGLHLPRVLWA